MSDSLQYESSTESRESTPMETTDSGDDTSSEHSSSVEIEMEWDPNFKLSMLPEQQGM